MGDLTLPRGAGAHSLSSKERGSGAVMRDLPTYRLNTAAVRKSRSEQTLAEEVLWDYLRARRLRGFKFRRQVPIGPFIADFCCFEKRLIIELDGRHHALQRAADENRTHELESLGFRVIRIPNRDVLRCASLVCKQIAIELGSVPSPGGEGGPAGGGG